MKAEQLSNSQCVLPVLPVSVLSTNWGWRVSDRVRRHISVWIEYLCISFKNWSGSNMITWPRPDRSDSDLDLCGTPASVWQTSNFHSYFFLFQNQTGLCPLTGPQGPTGSDVPASHSVSAHRETNNENRQITVASTASDGVSNGREINMAVVILGLA